MGGIRATSTNSSVVGSAHRSVVRTAILGALTLAVITAIAVILIIHVT